jgi:DNA-binding CsgD family transcriptional regulator
VPTHEAEVLYWLAQGKSNPDIATILGAGVRTVHKHVENLFRKLGLETRNAAALTALEILRPPNRSSFS